MSAGADSSSRRDYVVIVSGLPRSGTSMMMKMLEAGGVPAITDGLREADEDNPLGYYEFEPAKKIKADSSWLEDARGKAVKMVYQLLYDLPTTGFEYRVLFMRRALPEVLASQRKMLERMGKDPNAVPDEVMARMFRSQLAKFEAWVAEQPSFRILDIDYNAMMADPEQPILAINDLLGGDMNVDAMRGVIQPSLYRNRGADLNAGAGVS